MVVGARLGDRATGRLDSFCPKTGIVHIDIDACEVGKLRIPQVGITADAADALNALLPLLHNNDHEPWLQRVAACKAEHGLRFDRTDEVCSPYGIIHQVAEILDGKGIVATDVGQHQMRVAQAYPMTQPRQWLTSGGLGTMGFGLPAAMGAAVAKPEETVAVFPATAAC